VLRAGSLHVGVTVQRQLQIVVPVIGGARLVIDDVQHAARPTRDHVDRAFERDSGDIEREHLLDRQYLVSGEFFDGSTCALASVLDLVRRDVRELERGQLACLVDRSRHALDARGTPYFEGTVRERSEATSVGDRRIGFTDADEARPTFA
jgi:hypothetical protein